MCVECGKIFKNIRTLSQHRKIHTGLRPYKCQICGKSFVRKDVMLEHFRAHDPSSALYVCQVCGKTFARRFSLQTHMMHHAPHKKYACTVCQKLFFTRSNLKEHEEIHQDKKQCPKCNVYVLHLTAHARTCGTDAVFACTTCGKMFPQKRYLLQHQITHSQVREYSCQNCGKGFKHRASLRYHNKKGCSW